MDGIKFLPIKTSGIRACDGFVGRIYKIGEYSDGILVRWSAELRDPEYIPIIRANIRFRGLGISLDIISDGQDWWRLIERVVPDPLKSVELPEYFLIPIAKTYILLTEGDRDFILQSMSCYVFEDSNES